MGEKRPENKQKAILGVKQKPEGDPLNEGYNFPPTKDKSLEEVPPPPPPPNK